MIVEHTIGDTSMMLIDTQYRTRITRTNSILKIIITQISGEELGRMVRMKCTHMIIDPRSRGILHTCLV